MVLVVRAGRVFQAPGRLASLYRIAIVASIVVCCVFIAYSEKALLAGHGGGGPGRGEGGVVAGDDRAGDAMAGQVEVRRIHFQADADAAEFLRNGGGGPAARK